MANNFHSEVMHLIHLYDKFGNGEDPQEFIEQYFEPGLWTIVKEDFTSILLGDIDHYTNKESV